MWDKQCWGGKNINCSYNDNSNFNAIFISKLNANKSCLTKTNLGNTTTQPYIYQYSHNLLFKQQLLTISSTN